jgi:hypothetical protein
LTLIDLTLGNRAHIHSNDNFIADAHKSKQKLNTYASFADSRMFEVAQFTGTLDNASFKNVYKQMHIKANT